MQIRIHNTGYEKFQLVTSYIKHDRDNIKFKKDIKNPEWPYFFFV
jgi:hypothetical protein